MRDGSFQSVPGSFFPGNLQGRHPKETGAKGCTLVTAEDRRIVAVEHRSVDVLRWAVVELDLTGLDVAQLTAHLANAAGRALADADGRPTILRLLLTGTTTLHGRLLDDTERLAAECLQAALLAGGQLWIESVRVLTRPVNEPGVDLLTPLRDAFFVGLDDPKLIANVLEDFRELRRKLPATARDKIELPVDATALRCLAEDAWSGLANALPAGEPT